MINSSNASHKSRAQHSTTLNRKYVRRPSAKTTTSMGAATATHGSTTPKLYQLSSSGLQMANTSTSTASAHATAAALKSDAYKRRAALAEQLNHQRITSMKKSTSYSVTKSKEAIQAEQSAIKSATHPKNPTITDAEKRILKKTSAKDQAMSSALRKVATMDATPDKKLTPSRTITFKRVLLALACSAIVVGGGVFLVMQNASSIPVSVAAIQAGIDTIYPSYIPRDYSLSGVVSEEGKITMTFSTADGSSFDLTEEVSSWDSATLERNDVKQYFTEYSIITEGGLTLYISGSDCMWVNGGIKFYINASSNNLTKKQIKSIAASL